MRVIDLREEETREFSKITFREGDLFELNSSGKFDVEGPNLLTNGNYRVRSRGWVGQIPVGEDLLIRVAPKVGVKSVFRMLEVAYNLRSFRLFDGEVEIESLEEVYERIVSILSARVLDRVRKGLYRTYVGFGEELPYVRGRIDDLGAVTNKMRGLPRIPCDYEEQTEDVDENRILRWTLHRVPRQGLRRKSVRVQLDRARRALAGAIALEEFSPAECINRLYHRLNDDYAPMHGLCRFILENTGPGIGPGDSAFVPFELNMPQLFQSFVAEWMRQNAPPGTVVRPQYNARLDSNFEMSIHVDVVLCDKTTQSPLIVFDTKYKTNEQPSEQDMYQIAFYARELDVRRGVLIYPSPASQQFRIRHGGGILLESMIFDLTISLDIAGPAFLTELNTRLGLAAQPRIDP